jgi:catechol 2,3-dioxygenase-like lactoylglutathione lyase family enzyme
LEIKKKRIKEKKSEQMRKIKLKFGPIQIFVSDLEKAKKWYTEILGMKIVKEYPEFKCVLMKLGKIEFDIGVPNPSWGETWDKVKIGGRSPIVFETNDIKKVIKELKEKGVKFVEEPSKTPWEEMKAIFVDPDGNEFTLIEVIS